MKAGRFYLVEAFSQADFNDSVNVLLRQGWRLQGAPVAWQLYDAKTEDWTFYYSVGMMLTWWGRALAWLRWESKRGELNK
jgi:hypothetical protein